MEMFYIFYYKIFIKYGESKAVTFWKYFQNILLDQIFFININVAGEYFFANYKIFPREISNNIYKLSLIFNFLKKYQAMLVNFYFLIYQFQMSKKKISFFGMTSPRF